ncbi:short-chain collagen C4-like [Mytilus galloprovincialis]|uniref:short-chain collagen C4-like n=1 Tax=Mytilus galloprovincialis TaxID=29158 RepID=UPI003F7CA583
MFLSIIATAYTLSLLLFLVHGNTCSGDRNCEDIVTMPLLDGLRATLKADLDVKNMNDHLKTYIASEIKKGFANAMNDVMKQIVNTGLEEINATIIAAIQESLAEKGVTYIRWGRKGCPAGADIIYTGQVGGNSHANRGGGVNYLCLPNDPENGQHQPYSNAQVYGSEYELGTSYKPSGWSESMNNKEVPCAVCLKKQRSNILVIPGRQTCYDGWTSEYSGYLMSGHISQQGRDFVCLDKIAEPLDNNNGNEDGALFYVLRTSCGSLRCPPYTNQADVFCVVCTK